MKWFISILLCYGVFMGCESNKNQIDDDCSNALRSRRSHESDALYTPPSNKLHVKYLMKPRSRTIITKHEKAKGNNNPNIPDKNNEPPHSNTERVKQVSYKNESPKHVHKSYVMEPDRSSTEHIYLGDSGFEDKELKFKKNIDSGEKPSSSINKSLRQPTTSIPKHDTPQLQNKVQIAFPVTDTVNKTSTLNDNPKPKTGETSKKEDSIPEIINSINVNKAKDMTLVDERYKTTSKEKAANKNERNISMLHTDKFNITIISEKEDLQDKYDDKLVTPKKATVKIITSTYNIKNKLGNVRTEITTQTNINESEHGNNELDEFRQSLQYFNRGYEEEIPNTANVFPTEYIAKPSSKVDRNLKSDSRTGEFYNPYKYIPYAKTFINSNNEAECYANEYGPNCIFGEKPSCYENQNGDNTGWYLKGQNNYPLYNYHWYDPNFPLRNVQNQRNSKDNKRKIYHNTYMKIRLSNNKPEELNGNDYNNWIDSNSRIPQYRAQRGFENCYNNKSPLSATPYAYYGTYQY